MGINTKNLELDIMPSGEIRFCRCDKETNQYLLQLLKDLNINNIEDLEEFFESGNNIEILLGDEQLCG